MKRLGSHRSHPSSDFVQEIRVPEITNLLAPQLVRLLYANRESDALRTSQFRYRSKPYNSLVLVLNIRPRSEAKASDRLHVGLSSLSAVNSSSPNSNYNIILTSA